MIFTESLKKNADFKKVYSRGHSAACRYLVLYLQPNQSSKNRLGISVSKKVGNAVTRNRIKRLIKESYRLSEEKMPIGYDIVVVARVTAGSLCRKNAFGEISRSLLYVLKKHNKV